MWFYNPSLILTQGPELQIHQLFLFYCLFKSIWKHSGGGNYMSVLDSAPSQLFGIYSSLSAHCFMERCLWGVINIFNQLKLNLSQCAADFSSRPPSFLVWCHCPLFLSWNRRWKGKEGLQIQQLYSSKNLCPALQDASSPRLSVGPTLKCQSHYLKLQGPRMRLVAVKACNTSYYADNRLDGAAKNCLLSLHSTIPETHMVV